MSFERKLLGLFSYNSPFIQNTRHT